MVPGQLSDIEIRRLRVFRVIAEAGGFSQASDAAHLAQSALSRHVRLLEVQTSQRLRNCLPCAPANAVLLSVLHPAVVELLVVKDPAEGGPLLHLVDRKGLAQSRTAERIAAVVVVARHEQVGNLAPDHVKAALGDLPLVRSIVLRDVTEVPNIGDIAFLAILRNPSRLRFEIVRILLGVVLGIG